MPYEEYLRLVEAKEMLEDIVAFDEAMAAGDEELVPHSVVKRLAEGERPVRVWREHRGLTQEELASRAGIRSAYLSQIENGISVGIQPIVLAPLRSSSTPEDAGRLARPSCPAVPPGRTAHSHGQSGWYTVCFHVSDST